MKTKKMRAGAAEIRAELLTRWAAAMDVLDCYTKKQADNFFFCIKRGIISRIIAKAGSNARLNAWDENIFEYYKRLMEYYNNTVLIYVQEKEKIKNTKIKVILGGIYSVLSSELKQYRDSITAGGQNPVRSEKRELIKKGVELFMTGFDACLNAFSRERISDCLEYGRRALSDGFSQEASARLSAYIMNGNGQLYFENIYKYYCDAVFLCSEQLNNAEARKLTYFYYGLLKKEQDILSSIIKIQVSALERELERNNCNPEEIKLVNAILPNLREGYQYLGGEIKDIMAGFSEASVKAASCPAEDYDEFLNYVKNTAAPFSAHTFENVKSEYGERLDAFVYSLRAEVEFICGKRLGDFALKKNVYEAQKRVSEQLAMAEELTAVFARVTAYYAENAGGLAAEEGCEIMNGINETLEIKLDSIVENQKLFSEECAQTISDFANDKGHITPEDKAAVYGLLYEEWKNRFISYELGGAPGGDVKAFFEEFHGNELMTELTQRTERIKQSREERVNKAIMNFKREHLLYEVSTFEEILVYSVSRLRELGGAATEGYLALIDEVTVEIKTILKKNNIKLIEPAPHDMFNGKEHEVLMAEKNGQFNKGEIIKLMNSGYMQNDAVILRANVIAAK